MKNINAIGLDTSKAKQLAENLNELLANYSIFYQNLHGYHWPWQPMPMTKTHE